MKWGSRAEISYDHEPQLINSWIKSPMMVSKYRSTDVFMLSTLTVGPIICNLETSSQPFNHFVLYISQVSFYIIIIIILTSLGSYVSTQVHVILLFPMFIVLLLFPPLNSRWNRSNARPLSLLSNLYYFR